MASENLPNYHKWRHFLSSLKKSEITSSPEKQKDVFLGSIDCFSTNFSRQLLKTSGQEIETELPKSSLKKLKTSFTPYEPKQGSIASVSGSMRPENIQNKALPKYIKTQAHTEASNTTANQTFSDQEVLTEARLAVEKKSFDEVEDGRQKVSGYIENVSNMIEVDSFSNPKVLQKQSCKLKEGIATTSYVEAPMEEKGDDKVSERQVKAIEDVKHSPSGLVSSFPRPKLTDSLPTNFNATDSLKGNAKENFLDCLSQKEHSVKVHTVLPAAAISEINETIETDRVRQRYSNKNKRKVDVDIPCSQWTLEMLSNYVDFEQTVGQIQQKLDPGVSQNIIERTVQQALSQIESVQQVIFAPCKSSVGHRKPKLDSDDIYDLSNITGRETDVRILLDAVLIPFAKEMQLNIETEKHYRNKNLPNCQFDYRIHSENDVVGLVEAKSRIHGNGIGPEAIVQGILQLSALQAEVYRRMERENQKVVPLSFFNIISDGYQFIFIQLDHDKLLFDHQPGKNIYGEEMPTIRCYVMDSRKAIKKILVKMFGLLKAVKSVHQDENAENVEMEDFEENVEQFESIVNDENVEMQDSQEIVLQYETDEKGTIILD